MEVLINRDGALVLVIRNWWTDAKELYDGLVTEVAWSQYTMNQFGKTINVPRLNYIVGDDNVDYYNYSRNKLPVVSWSNISETTAISKVRVIRDAIVTDSTLKSNISETTAISKVRVIRDAIVTDSTLKSVLEKYLQVTESLRFDSCMLNYYPTGSNYIAYHRDREALGVANAVVTISLGCSRKFTFKRLAKSKSEANISTILNAGDLVLMAGKTQELYTHTLPKTVKLGSRISLTYRLIKP